MGWSATATFATRHLFMETPQSFSKAKPVGTPDAGTFWRVIEDHNVKVLFTAPTAFRAIKREDPNAEFLAKYDTLVPEGSVFWPESALTRIRSNGLRINWVFRSSTTGGKRKPDGLSPPILWELKTSPSRSARRRLPMPGYDVQILDDGGHPLPAGELGAIAVKLPLPPGTLPNTLERRRALQKELSVGLPGILRNRGRRVCR